MKTLRALAVIIVILVASFNSIYPYIYLNYTDSTYNNSGKRVLYPLDSYIVDGAGYFLESYTNALVLIRKVELSTKFALNNDELLSLLNNSIDNMTLANKAYLNIKSVAENSDYNPVIIDSLKKFDYESFLIEKSLNRDILYEVKYYLEQGDMRGIYSRILSDTEKILIILKELKANIINGDSLPIAGLWKLNQLFSQSLLFGQYTSQIFSAIIHVD